MSRLRAAVIGLGVGEKLAETVASLPDCELASICDLDRPRLDAIGARWPSASRTTNAEEVLRDANVDLVCIASFDDHHFAQVMTALEHGKHVFVEKPFVQREAEARAVKDALKARPSLRLSSNLILRRSPRFLDLRRRIDAGELGRLYHLEGDYNYGRLHKIVEGWRGKLDFYSAVQGGGVHVADLLMWLARDRIVEVSAVGNAIASEGSGFRNFDMVVSTLKFAGGAVGKLGVNFGCVFPHFHPMAIYGTDATFVNAPEHALLYRSRDPGAAPTKLDTEYPGTHKGDLIASFVGAIRGRGEAEVTERDVFDSLAVCFAIERSAHTGTPVKVEYLWDEVRT